MALPDDLDAALDGLGFPAYEGRDVGPHADARRELFALVDRLLTDEQRAQINEHLGRWRTKERFYEGVSAAREDRNRHWEEQLETVRARSSGHGAVQLELGVWSRFPDERRTYLRDKDGLAELIRLDFDGGFPVDVVGDARRLPFGDATIDRISADSLLEHIPDPHLVIRECLRVLRPGGFVRFATPFVFNLHGYPDDFLRFTPSWYEHVCREAGFESVVTDSDAARGLYYTMHNTAKAAVVLDDADNAAGLRALHLLILELLGALEPLDNGFHNGARHWFHSVRCLAVTEGGLQLSFRDRADDSIPFAERCLDLLADPDGGGPLRREGDFLVGRATRYPVRADGVPDFTRGEALPRRGLFRRS